jgi:hypothetical protein
MILIALDDEDSCLLVDELYSLFSDSELSSELDYLSDFDCYSDSCSSLMLSSSYSGSYSENIS